MWLRRARKRSIKSGNIKGRQPICIKLLQKLSTPAKRGINYETELQEGCSLKRTVEGMNENKNIGLSVARDSKGYNP